MNPLAILILLFSIHFLQAQSASLEWVIGMGDAGNDQGKSIITDANGNVYITGHFGGMVDFDPDTLNSVILTANGATDIFIQKLDPNGNLLWVKQMGGIGPANEGNAILVDNNGNVYTTGRFYADADFDPGTGIHYLISNGLGDIFIQKLDPNGNFLWAKSMGSTADDAGNAIALDAAGNVYTTGYFQNTVDFDPGLGTNPLTAVGISDIFIQKLDPNGNFIWAKTMGGTADDAGNAIALDVAGNIYTIGQFNQTINFDPGMGMMAFTSNGGSDIFIQKLDNNGNFLWAKTMGGINDDVGKKLIVDNNNNIYTIGHFSDVVDFDPNLGTTNFTSNGLSDIFLQKLDNNGNLIWAKTMGGANYDVGESITIDTAGYLYTTGYFGGGVDFDLGTGVMLLNALGLADIFIQKLDNNGNFIWVKQMGGVSYEHGNAITTDLTGNIYTTGSFFNTTDFDPNTGVVTLVSAGQYDIFVQKLSQSNFNAVSSLHSSISKLYPNPSTNQLIIELEKVQEATISILDNQGRLVHPPLLIKEQQTSLELAHLPTGIYYISVTTSNNTTISPWTKF
ncbi:MAG: SBBP repeat-containing protein [Aureispira sp.]